VTLSDVILRAGTQGRVLGNKLLNAEDQKIDITNETVIISPAMLAATLGDMDRRVDSCFQEAGNHFQHLL
jgi:hypothetical protein